MTRIIHVDRDGNTIIIGSRCGVVGPSRAASPLRRVGGEAAREDEEREHDLTNEECAAADARSDRAERNRHTWEDTK